MELLEALNSRKNLKTEDIVDALSKADDTTCTYPSFQEMGPGVGLPPLGGKGVVKSALLVNRSVSRSLDTFSQ